MFTRFAFYRFAVDVRHAFLFAVTAFFIGVSAPALQSAEENRDSAEPWPFELSDLEPDPSVTWGELEIGVRYAIMPNSEPRDRVSLRLYIGSGSLSEKEDQLGLAHLLEHMAFNGTENFGAGTLVEYFQRLGMAFGADTNAYTSFDRTVYMIELPDSMESSIAEGLLVLRDYAGRMLLEESEIEAERRVVLSEMRTRDSVGYRTALAEYAFLLPESIVPNRFPIGTAEVVGNATRELLLDFYDAWYRPANTVIVAVGDVEPEKMAELIGDQFADFSARGPAREKPDLGQVVADGLQVKLHTEMEAPNTRVSIQTMMPIDPQPDTLELRVARMHRNAAMQILTRRLDTLSRQEDAPFSRGSASAYEMFQFASNASIDLTCEPEEWEEALQVAERELRRALLHGFQESELEEIKADLLNAYEEAERRSGTRKSPGLTESIIRSLSQNYVFTSPQTELELMRPKIEAMTVDDALFALRESWSPKGRFVFVTGNLSLENAEEAISQAYQASRNLPVEPMEEWTGAEFAYTDFGPAGEIAEQRYVEDLDLYQIRFENGVRLNLKQTDFQANAIQTQIRLGAGQLTEPEEMEGVALLSSLTFNAGGLGEHSADDLRRILAGRNAGVGFSVGEDAFLLAGSTTPADLLLQLQLMAAYLSDPGYRPEALRLARNQLREIYRSSRHTAEGTLQAKVSRFLASGDHRFGLPPEENLMNLDLDDVRNWLREPLESGYLELTLIGDLSIEEAIEVVAQTVGALPERQAEKPRLEELRRIQFPVDASEREFSFESELPNGFALLYWPTDDMWNIGQTRRLQILARVFSDRLRIRIREEMGDAYSPYAVSRPSDTYEDYGLFYAVIGIAPERAREVAEVVLEIAADLHENGATLDELERALKPIVASLPRTLRENNYWMSSVLGSSQEYPQRLDWAREMVDDYASITTEEITFLAKKYLHPDRAIEVYVLPVDEESINR